MFCISRESNPGHPRGRREFYHWTTDAVRGPIRYKINLKYIHWKLFHGIYRLKKLYTHIIYTYIQTHSIFLYRKIIFVLVLILRWIIKILSNLKLKTLFIVIYTKFHKLFIFKLVMSIFKLYSLWSWLT